MTHTTNRLFDDLSRLATDAASIAQSARREVETMGRAQLERFMSDLDLISREEFEAVKAMAAKAREENTRLEARIAALEAKLGATDGESS